MNTNFNPLVLVMSVIAIGTWLVSNFFAAPVPVNNQLSQGTTSNVVVSSENEDAAAGLDLQALTELVATVKSAAELEEVLNKPDGINNLDLNADGQVDFIQVKEFGELGETTDSAETTGAGNKISKRGFTLLTEVAPGQVQEIATIEIIPSSTEINDENAQVQVNTYGNEQVYGSGVGYSSAYSMGSFFLMGYFLGSGGFYTSPYGYGRYPGYYNSYSRVNTRAYQSRTSPFSSRFRGSSINRGPTINSPYRGQSAGEGIARNLRNPTASQRSFQSRMNNSRNFSQRGGGFGRKQINTSARRNPFGIGSGSGNVGNQSRSGRSSLFGGSGRNNRSIFGRSSRSFSRGFRGFGRGFRGFRR